MSDFNWKSEVNEGRLLTLRCGSCLSVEVLEDCVVSDCMRESVRAVLVFGVKVC